MKDGGGGASKGLSFQVPVGMNCIKYSSSPAP